MPYRADMRKTVILAFLIVGISACEQPAPVEKSSEPLVTAINGPLVPRAKPDLPPAPKRTAAKHTKKELPKAQNPAESPALKAPSSLPKPTLIPKVEPVDDALPGTAITAEEAVRRTIQALAWNDQLELALVAPSLDLSDDPARIAPGVKIIRSERFTTKRTEDWNGLSLQPPVQIGDILVRTKETWSEDDPQKYAYLVRQSETGWAVLSRAKFRDSLS